MEDLTPFQRKSTKTRTSLNLYILSKDSNLSIKTYKNNNNTNNNNEETGQTSITPTNSNNQITRGEKRKASMMSNTNVLAYNNYYNNLSNAKTNFLKKKLSKNISSANLNVIGLKSDYAKTRKNFHVANIGLEKIEEVTIANDQVHKKSDDEFQCKY